MRGATPVVEEPPEAVEAHPSAVEAFRAQLRAWLSDPVGNPIDWRSETVLAVLKEYQMKYDYKKFRDRGPPGPAMGGPQTWQGQAWRANAKRWGNRGGAKREMYAKLHGNKAAPRVREAHVPKPQLMHREPMAPNLPKTMPQQAPWRTGNMNPPVPPPPPKTMGPPPPKTRQPPAGKPSMVQPRAGRRLQPTSKMAPPPAKPRPPARGDVFL